MSGTIKNKREFQQLFQDYYAVLCNFVYQYVQDRDTCEDLVQSVFVRLWENRKTIEISGSLKSYMFSAARNAALDHLRSQKRQDQMLQAQEISDRTTPEEMDRTRREMIFRQRLYDQIQALKPKTREIFVLHKMEGLTYQEIADHLKIPKRTVEYNIYTALAQLKEALAEAYDQYLTKH